ncbi:cob(I)yrinic acid a,c-diamide adenosyltransferase [Candidatus Formimonas warabiya]|uniref:Cob(I)yrinic acid a,c-diamide adenosyltransferase n=1 Tax=Formimonas warabiya TaxID=1761012 RepID=A0A3G1L277_FORW1|nr:cob(I)yrinic acid a,c-diamide adenosyltransferase [Candidatus Formimonas warabiya]ATW28886.1 cob(I)yrinic acid a,c-diamide adenosyltransferase [Candidatus Formimonas warabiya]
MGENGLTQGYIHVYTGNCKGKTTAALGLAFRAAGHGMKTFIGQFMKGQEYGELKSARMLDPFITIAQYGKESLIHVTNPPDPEDVRMAEAGLENCTRAMLSGQYDIVVFDEICTAYFFGLISLEEMIQVMNDKPFGVELVFTGRYAPQEVVDRADLVTEMKEIKHYYHSGVPAREGIER